MIVAVTIIALLLSVSFTVYPAHITDASLLDGVAQWDCGPAPAKPGTSAQ
jgi:hypothetical protein